MIRFAKAKLEDAKALAYASRKSFDNDVNYGAAHAGGPAGYKSEKWQSQMMRAGIYYKVLDGVKIIGGFVVLDKGEGHYHLERVFLHPDYQNKGVGAQTIRYMEAQFPDAVRWSLATPRWNRRTQKFYEKLGYFRVGKGGPLGVRYEKRVEGPSDC